MRLSIPIENVWRFQYVTEKTSVSDYALGPIDTDRLYKRHLGRFSARPQAFSCRLQRIYLYIILYFIA